VESLDATKSNTRTSMSILVDTSFMSLDLCSNLQIIESTLSKYENMKGNKEEKVEARRDILNAVMMIGCQEGYCME
jgi:hypothetical protein